jgi:hypothetical protein
MAHFFQDEADDFDLLDIQKQGSELSFGGRCSNMLEDGAKGVDCPIEENGFVVTWELPKEIVAARSASSAGFVEIGRIGVHL